MKRTPLKRRSWIKRGSSSLSRTTPLKASGPRGKRKQREYAAFLKSPGWIATRNETRRLFDYTCQCGCNWRDETETGRLLDCHHTNGYKKPLGSEIPGVDTTLLRRDHHRRTHWWKQRRAS